MDLKDGRKATTACNEATETKLDPALMQSIEEHRDIPKGEAAVMPGGEPRKRFRVRNLAAERRQKTRKGPGGKADLGGSRLPPVDRFPPCKSGMAKRETPQENL
jgi:hypothetical protein